MKKTKKADTSAQLVKPIVGEALDFASTEAYKLLRANLNFSLSAGDNKCKIIGVTSAIRGEGKSTTCINLAYSLSETGKNVALIDADLRLPSIARTLDIPRSPGLSNILTGMSEEEITVQKSGLRDSMYVITSGDIPPNPSELLGAAAMEKLISKLSETFDYIVIDLPPVTVVSDALVVSPLCDGVLLIARQDYTRKGEVDRAVELLTYGKAKILGYVFNCSKGNEKIYKSDRKSRYYKKSRSGYHYGYRYGYRYGYEKSKPAEGTVPETQTK